MIGQFAVAQGQKEAGKLVEQAGTVASRLGGFPGTPGPVTAAAGPTSGAAGAAASAASATPAAAVNVPSVNGTSTNGSARAQTAGAADRLAIPGYDTLSASQVVQRLGGLSAAELEAVRSYEQSTRSRRTILSKVSQLQAERH
jgi:hypothetical protein